MGLWQVPAVVLALVGWLTSPPTSLADAARREALRRESSAPAVRRFTNADLPPADTIAAQPPAVSNPPDVANPPATDAERPAPKAAPAVPVEKHDEAWWSKRMADARAALARDRLLVDAMQNRVDSLLTDWTNRDDPAQKAKLFEARQIALGELDHLKKDIINDTLTMEAIQDDARRQGVPPGWIR